ncbi:TonB-dependent siderophore receptor [Acinetobacter soli]|uniref:TonB-dependent siderophore receptor n=1 Tax=Acinetobacter soli TaxID=487316 RepID=UPI00258AD7CC|nr:TonB-dependent siderophore receptor [uncultured Acinetobacter sp.]
MNNIQYLNTIALFSSICLLGYSQYGYAAQIQTINTQLPTLTLEAEKSSSMKTATGLDLSLKETPQSVSVIAEQTLKQQGVTSIADALKRTTGINVIRDSGRYRFQSRGFYIDQIEEDGLSSTVPGAASNPFRTASSSTELDIYQHIEVLRGATGLTQANSEPGGTINAVRKHPTEDFQMHGYLQGGRWNHVRSMLDISGALNQNNSVRARTVTAIGHADSFKQDVSNDTALLYSVFDFDLTPATLLRWGAMYQKNNNTPDYFGLPMATGGTDTGLPASTYLAAKWSTQQFEKYNTFAELQYHLNDDWSISSKVNANFNQSIEKFAGLAQLAQSYSGISDSNSNLKMNNQQYYDNESHEVTANIGLNGKYRIFNNTHDLFATLSYSRLQENSRWKRVLNDTAYNVWTFNPEMIAQPDWNNIQNLFNDIEYHSQLEQKAVSLGTRVNFFNALHLILGGRYTDFKSSGDHQYYVWKYQPDSEYVKAQTVSKHKFIPYLGLTYDFTPETSAYISHTKIFKPQSAKDVSGNILPPVIGANDEVGLKSSWFDQRFNTSLALFRIKQQNRAMQDLNNTNFFIAEGKVKSQGVELELSGQATDQLSLFAGYTYNKSKYLKTESNTYPQGANFSKHTPNQMFRFYSQYQFKGVLNQLSAGLGLQAQTATSSLYNIAQGGYTLWDANLEYQIHPQLSVNLIGQNLTDKRYYENQRMRITGGNNFLGTPRNILVRLDWKY